MILDYLNQDSFDFNYKESVWATDQAFRKKYCMLKLLKLLSYLECKFNLKYTISGITDWLKKNNFSYKSLKIIPSKADVVK